MADLDNLEYYIKFPNPNFNYNQNEEHDFVPVPNEKIPVILLFGWAGSQDKYLVKYSQIYEEKGLIILRYTAPVKSIFFNRYQMMEIGEKLVKLLIDLHFETHPIIVHSLSNGGAIIYQNFSLALAKSPKQIPIRGIIFDSAPGWRSTTSVFRALPTILGGNIFYNCSMTIVMSMFLSMIWLYEIISNPISPKSIFQCNPLENLKNEENRWPQMFIYSKTDALVPPTDVEYFADYRKKLGIDITTICYETGVHVKHLVENRESYIKSVYSFVNRCLNRNK